MTAFALKLTALITMMLDHATHILWMSGTLRDYELYLMLRGIGRLAFPIYAFLIVNGFEHSRDRGGYLNRLALFALISQIPFTLCFADANYGGWPPGELSLGFTVGWEGLLLLVPLAVYIFLQGFGLRALCLGGFLLLPCLSLSWGGLWLLDGDVNVFFTLSLGLSFLICADRLKTAGERGKSLEYLLLPAALLPVLLIIQPHADYALEGVLLILALWLCRERRWAQLLVILLWASWQYLYDVSLMLALIPALLAILLMLPLKNKGFWWQCGAVLIWACVCFILLGFTFGVLPAFAGLSTLLIAAYNGKPGKRAKLVFYAAYPVHLLLFWLIYTFL